MGDHYDTAYMEDTYGYRSGKNDGARMAASGADDNHSATSALMLGAEMFMELSRAGKLARDIWIVHLTGEEFPSDCLGARHLAQSLSKVVPAGDERRHDRSLRRHDQRRSMCST